MIRGFAHFFAALTDLPARYHRRCRSRRSAVRPPVPALALGVAWVVAALSGTDVRSEVIRVGVDMNSQPLSFIDGKGEPDGYTKDLLGHLAKRTGLQFELVPDYWSRQMRGLRDGTLQAVANTLVTEERQATMDFSLPHSYLRGIAYVRLDSPKIKKVAGLAGKKIGVLGGTISETTARKQNNWGGQLVVFEKKSDIFEGLRLGTVDVAVGQLRSTAVANQQGIRHSFVDDLHFNFSIAVRKGDGGTLEQINRGLLELHLDGTIDELYRKWLGLVEARPLRWVDVRRFALPGGGIISILALYLICQFYAKKILTQRLQFARDLHDEQGNRLSEFQLLTERMALEQPTLAAPLRHLRQRIFEATQSLDELVSKMRPGASPWSHVGSNLEQISRSYLELAGVKAEINIDVDLVMADQRSDHRVRRALLMITRELLRNAVQHAKPEWVSVDLEVTALTVMLAITDSGRGINMDDALAAHRGIFHLKERVQELRGSFRFGQSDAGFSVFVTLSLKG